MQSSLYSHVSTRQPCTPSSSCAVPRTAAPKLRSSRSANLQYCSSQHVYGEPVTALQRLRHGCVPRATASSSMFSDPQPMHQHQQHIPAPEWHPRLFGIKESKRAAMENAARLYYGEVWAGGSLDLLDELAAAGVCFNDALGMEADAFSRASLKSIIQEFQASHPLLKFDLEDVLVDEQRDTAIVHYTVTAAHLLPQGESEATGHVSVVSGMDKIKFDGSGLISSILSFRQRFMEEEAEPINWDAV